MPRFVRFREDCYPFFITTVVEGRRPIFADEGTARLMVQVLDETRRRYGFLVLSFVVMPNHVHLLVVPRPGDTVSQVARFIKGTFARRYNVTQNRTGAVWQPRFYERMVRDDRGLSEVLEYIDMNPVVEGLVGRPEQWPFGSASAAFEGDLEVYFTREEWWTS